MPSIFSHVDYWGDTVHFNVEGPFSAPAGDVDDEAQIDNLRAISVEIPDFWRVNKEGDEDLATVYIPLERIPELITALAHAYRGLTGEYALASAPESGS